MIQQQSNHTDNIKDIESGIYRDSYLIYNRKSTDEPENQKNSIQYQKSENTRFAYREQLQVAQVTIDGFCTDGIISEKHSAFKEDNELLLGENGIVQYRIDRPKFYKLIQLLNNGYFKGVIVLCWDRISRNKGDETVIRKLIKTGIDFRFVLATYDKTSSGALHMDIDGMFAEHHSRVTSEKVSLNIRNHRERGICTYRAPVGYLNLGQMEYKPFDEERAPVIKRMFELYATGDWTLSSLVEFAKSQGFTMPPFRRRRTLEEKLAEEDDDIQIEIEAVSRTPTSNTIHKILNNRFYCGKVLGNNGLYVTSNSHKPLISEELFDSVQAVLSKKKVSVHYTQKLEHPFRGLVRCESCTRVYTPYEKKGMVYFGSRCAKDCLNPNKSFNADFVAMKINLLIKNLSFTEDELYEINRRANTDVAVLELNRVNEMEVNERQKKKLREELTYLRSNKLLLLKAGVYNPESLIQEEDSLVKQITKLLDAEQISELAMHETIKEVIKLSELLKTIYDQYHFGNYQDKDAIVRLIFSELNIYGKTLSYKCKKGFSSLESRFVALGDPNTWLSELPHHLADIRYSITILQVYCKTGNRCICIRPSLTTRNAA